MNRHSSPFSTLPKKTPMASIMTKTTTNVWFDVVDASGATTLGTRGVSLQDGSCTIHLRDAAQATLPSEWGLSTVDLVVYASHADFKAKNELDLGTAFPGEHGYDQLHPVVIFLKSYPPKTLKRGGCEMMMTTAKGEQDEGVRQPTNAKRICKTVSSTCREVPADDWFADGKFQLQETATSTDPSTSVRFLMMREFPPLAHAVRLDNIVMERACYVTIFDQLVEIIADADPQNEFKNIHIGGNPGIGKSRFYLYCIFRLALDETVRASLPDFQLVLNYKNKYHVYDPQTKTFKSIAQDRSSKRSLMDSSHVLRLVEEDSDALDGWNGKSVFFSTSQHPGINSFLKENGRTFIMPAWTLEELRTFNCLPPAQEVWSVSDTTLVDLFRVRGGIPRSIFGTCPIQYQTLLATALNTMDAHELVAAVECNGPSDPTDEWIYDLLVMVPTRDDFATCDKWEFVSPHIASLVKEKTTGRAAREMP